MAEDKKSFILYCDQEGAFEELTDEEAGKLIKHIYRYVNDRNPEPPDRFTKIVFEPIKHQLKRDLKDWETKKVNRSDAGKLGGIKSGEARRKQNEANEAMLQNAKQNEANEAVTVNVTVTDTVLGKPNGAQTQPLADDFEKPAFAEVKQYFQTQNPGGSNYALNLTDASDFWDHYESNGWMVGPNKMRSWQAGIRKWIKNKGQFSNGEVKKAVGEHDWEKSLQ